MKTLMFVVLFLLIGAFFIIANENIKLDSKENVYYLFDKYGQWFDKLIGNGRTAVGYAIKMQWLPESK
ncbi:MAG: hypothetical protein PHH54_05885 [Candidatus Nanoarchaeia archaeon]|nr:hypothetical protein [Candidatus Nanoarchaeia archaeon]MDD5741485.1 hypothetical protein [Candidatus Nanoarchaeia archaeon]